MTTFATAEMTAGVTARRWDTVVIGAGHNGLTAAAYLARAGRSVLVIEARARIGGACTLDRPFADQGFVISPCAYAVGLLHPRVIDELDLRRHGYQVHLIDPHLWCPFDDGSALSLWDDHSRNHREVAAISPDDADGYVTYERLFTRIRTALRSEPHDTWIGDAPDRPALEELLGHDKELIEVMLEEPIASVIERHVKDERLRTALHGQGLIGTWAGPRDRGTAAIHAMHSMGTIEGRPAAWGYVQGGMGTVSYSLASAATEAGAVIIRNAPVREVVPGEAVILADGTRILAATIVSNADPRTTLGFCRDAAPAAFAERVDAWRMEGPVFKINCALARLPRFTAAGAEDTPYRSMVTIARTTDETQAAYERSRMGEPSPRWAELYFHSAYDQSVVPAGKHVMSVFAQYAPYTLATGSWDERRDAVADQALAEIARFAPDILDCIESRQVLAPPDIERETGLSGGHIFQGECLPDQMWDRRFSPRTPIPGLYMCGASTHPGGSVIAVNGRNCAMALLADTAARTAS